MCKPEVGGPSGTAGAMRPSVCAMSSSYGSCKRSGGQTRSEGSIFDWKPLQASWTSTTESMTFITKRVRSAMRMERGFWPAFRTDVRVYAPRSASQGAHPKERIPRSASQGAHLKVRDQAFRWGPRISAPAIQIADKVNMQILIHTSTSHVPTGPSSLGPKSTAPTTKNIQANIT